jgi:acetyl-CoA acetyltransferase
MSSTVTAGAEAAQPDNPTRGVAVLCACLLMLAALVDSQVVGAIAPQVAAGVGASKAAVAASVTAYSIAAACVALVLARGAKATRAKPVYLRSAVFKTRRFGSFEVFSPSIPVHDGVSPTAEAAAAAFEQAGVGPGDVEIAQLQDTESGAEIMHLAETGLCRDGEQEHLVQSGATRIGGRLPVNTDGGCLANGEPIGASGLRQVHEVVLQLRGEAGERQIPGPARVGFTQVYGAPGVSACTVLST